MDPFEVTESDLAQPSCESKQSHPTLGDEYPSKKFYKNYVFNAFNLLWIRGIDSVLNVNSMY